MKITTELKKEKGGRYVCKQRTWKEDNCEDCGLELEWQQDTEEWHLNKGIWEHSNYGEPYSSCECGMIYHGMPDGSFIKFRLDGKMENDTAG